jgi:hypothetical protein
VLRAAVVATVAAVRRMMEAIATKSGHADYKYVISGQTLGDNLLMRRILIASLEGGQSQRARRAARPDDRLRVPTITAKTFREMVGTARCAFAHLQIHYAKAVARKAATMPPINRYFVT